MSSQTPKLRLMKWSDPGTDVFSNAELMANWDAVDSHAFDITHIIPITVCTSATRPGSPAISQYIYETDTVKIQRWGGSSWTDLGSPPAGQHFLDVTTGKTLKWYNNAMVTLVTSVSDELQRSHLGALVTGTDYPLLYHTYTHTRQISGIYIVVSTPPVTTATTFQLKKGTNTGATSNIGAPFTLAVGAYNTQYIPAPGVIVLNQWDRLALNVVQASGTLPANMYVNIQFS